MKRKVTLKKFVEENHRLITVAGVFAALTAFFLSNYQNGYLSFSSFSMFLLVCWELWVSFPKNEEATRNLKFFEYMFMVLLFGVAFQILVSYKDVILKLSAFILFAGYLLILTNIVEKYKIYLVVRKISKKHKRIEVLIRSLVFICGLILAFFLAKYSLELLKRYW